MEDGSNRFATGFVDNFYSTHHNFFRFQALGHSMIPLLFFHGVVVLIAITALVIIIPPLIQKIKKITKKS